MTKKRRTPTKRAPTKAPPSEPRTLLMHPIKQRIIDKLLEKSGGNPVCPICHTVNFAVGEYTMFPAVNAPGAYQMGGKGYPAVGVICQNCGCIQFLNILTLGFEPEDFASLTLPGEPENTNG